MKHHGIGSIVPALAQNARTGHPQFRNGRENERVGHPPLGQCAGGPTLANQTWTINGFALSGDIKSLSYNCSQVLVNGQ
jgi:hypothetical protein